VNDVAQTAPSRELSGRQGEKLAPAGHAAQFAPLMVLSSQGLKLMSREQLEKLGKDGRMMGQGLDPPLFAWVSGQLPL
jgi:hypothetical protein